MNRHLLILTVFLSLTSLKLISQVEESYLYNDRGIKKITETQNGQIISMYEYQKDGYLNKYEDKVGKKIELSEFEKNSSDGFIEKVYEKNERKFLMSITSKLLSSNGGTKLYGIKKEIADDFDDRSMYASIEESRSIKLDSINLGVNTTIVQESEYEIIKIEKVYTEKENLSKGIFIYYKKRESNDEYKLVRVFLYSKEGENLERIEATYNKRINQLDYEKWEIINEYGERQIFKSTSLYDPDPDSIYKYSEPDEKGNWTKIYEKQYKDFYLVKEREIIYY